MTETATENGVALNFVLPVGERGEQGEKGEPGDTPVITVAEDTPVSYKLRFQTGDEEIVTPNLFAPLQEYHVDLSAAGSTLNIPLGNLILIYQYTSTTSVRISVRPADAEKPVLTDMRRSSIYGGGSIDVQTFNNTTVSGTVVLDDIVYSMSQEEHSMKIRQRDPDSELWSLCEIRSFISAGGARTSVWVRRIESDVSYPAP